MELLISVWGLLGYFVLQATCLNSWCVQGTKSSFVNINVSYERITTRSFRRKSFFFFSWVWDVLDPKLVFFDVQCLDDEWMASSKWKKVGVM